MLKNVRYEPTEGALLYHYCAPATLFAILQNRTLRLSDIGEMNDSMELEWGLDVLGRVLDQIPDLPPVLLETIENARADVKDGTMCMASCFSTQGDVLSQWRAYADNAAGFSIGFDPVALATLPVNLFEVVYDREVQEQRVIEHLVDLMEKFTHLGDPDHDPGALFDPAEEDDPPDFTEEDRLVRRQFSDIVRMVNFAVYDLASFKNPAFSEESEVRVVHLVQVDKAAGNAVQLLPGAEAGKWVGDREARIGFAMKGAVPVCFVDIPILPSAIKEIIVGPRAHVTGRALGRLLATLGYSDVAVRFSKASYR